MINQLMELVRDSGQQTVVENPEVPNEKNEAVMEEASSSIHCGLKDMLQTGGPGALKRLFEGVQSGDNDNPAVQQVANQFSGNLTQKLGIGSGTAKSIAGKLIPAVLGKLMNRSKNAESDSSFSIGNILGSLSGGDGQLEGPGQPDGPGQPQGEGGLMGKISNMGTRLGLDKDGDGDTDLKDLLSMFRR